jgi:hypothetical protein
MCSFQHFTRLFERIHFPLARLIYNLARPYLPNYMSIRQDLLSDHMIRHLLLAISIGGDS